MSENEDKGGAGAPSLTCHRCGAETESLSADWEECGECSLARDEWERDTPEWKKLGMSSMWEDCL